MARLAPFSGAGGQVVVQNPFRLASEGALSSKLRLVHEKALREIGETPANAATIGVVKELPSIARTNQGGGGGGVFSVSSKHPHGHSDKHSDKQCNQKHSQSAPTLESSSLDRRGSSGSVNFMKSPWLTDQGSTWSRMRGARSSYPGQPPAMDALEFREIMRRPGPEHYAIGTFDSSFEVDDTTRSVHEPFLTHHKRCAGVVRLGSGPEDLDAPKATRVVEKGAKGLQDKWRPFCLEPGRYAQPDLWATFSPPQPKKGSRFAAKAIQAEERNNSTSHQCSTGGAKPARAESREHAIYDTDRSVTCAAPTRIDAVPSIHTKFTAQSKKAANAPRHQMHRKNAVLLDVSPDGPAGMGPDAQRALSGLQMGRQHLLIHALIKDMEEMQVEKRRRRLDRQLQQDAGVRIASPKNDGRQAGPDEIM